MMTLTPTYDVQLWEPRPRGSGKAGWRVRWKVAGREHNRTLPETAANALYAKLATARKVDGEAFDTASGLPISLAMAELEKAYRQRQALTCVQAISEYIDTKWEEASGNHRRNLAEVLMWAAMALLPNPRNGVAVRRALRTRQFNPADRAEATDEDRRWMDWAEKHSPTVEYLADLANVRDLLGAMHKQFNGKPRSAHCKKRARSILNGFLKFAAEQNYIPTNQVASLPLSRKKMTGTIDRRRVPNLEQKSEFIGNVAGLVNGYRYVAYFALIAFAGLRPEESIDFRKYDLELPEEIGHIPLRDLTDEQKECWATLHIHETAPVVGSAWTDSRTIRDDRGLKQRERGEVRTAPSEPKLTRILIDHMLHPQFQEGPDGQINTRPDGELLADSTIRRKFHAARALTLSNLQESSKLMARPYDLRHSCISEWLADVGDPAVVAEWAGHTVAVLLRVYAKFIDGREEAARKRIQQARDGRRLQVGASPTEVTA